MKTRAGRLLATVGAIAAALGLAFLRGKRAGQRAAREKDLENALDIYKRATDNPDDRLRKYEGRGYRD